MYQYQKPDNLVSLFEESVQKHGKNPLFGIKDTEKKIYRWLTYEEISVRVDNLRSGLAYAGVSKGDRVGIIANNRPEWAIAAFATWGRGACFVPMYEAELPETWEYIIRDSGMKVLFVSSSSIYEKVKDFLITMPDIEYIFIIDDDSPLSMIQLEKKGSLNKKPSIHPGAYDVASLIYTSGTTGFPKGVLLSHGNITSNIHDGIKSYPELTVSEVSISILPWAHTFGQTVELFSMIKLGAAIGFIESMRTILEDISLLRPTLLVAVPKVFNTIYNGIQEKMAQRNRFFRALFTFSCRLVHRKFLSHGKRKFLPVTSLFSLIFDALIFSKIRKLFGGRIKGCMTGSAIMNVDISIFFFSIGIPVYDCYGMTETSPGISMNRSYDYRIGTAGKPVENVRIVIDSERGDPEKGDGEIIVYGPNVMQGYYNRPLETANVMTHDGGFRTGDRGRIDEDGFLHITGRIKEQFKLDNGKYVFPSSLEEDARLSPYIDNIMIYGEGKPYTVGLLVPDLTALESGGFEARPGEGEGVERLLANELLSRLKSRYGSYEIPKKIVILNDSFSVEDGTLTQTLKLKRENVIRRYQREIDMMYDPPAERGSPVISLQV